MTLKTIKTLFGKNEFINKNNKTFPIYLVKDKSKYLIDFISDFIKNSNKEYCLGIDFEFDSRKGSSKMPTICQIIFDDNTNINPIYMFDPMDYTNILIKLFTVPYITKILHGCESLDIPWVFNDLLKTKENINNFCSNFYDTKILCDYQNIIKGSKERCSIYYLLVNNKIISKDKLEELEKIEPNYRKPMIINKLSEEEIIYCLYDVIYLPDLLKSFDTTPKIIMELMILQLKSKNNFENLNEIVEFVGIQNSLYKDDFKMIELFEYYFYVFYLENKYKFIHIPFLKNLCLTLIKYFIFKKYLKQNKLSFNLDIEAWFDEIDKIIT